MYTHSNVLYYYNIINNRLSYKTSYNSHISISIQREVVK